MIKKDYIFLFFGIIVLVILIGVFLITNSKNKITGGAVKEIVGIYELLTDNDVEILTVKEEGGLKKVTIGIKNDAGNINAQEIYVTRDNKYITDKLVNIADYRTRLNSEKEFTSCLKERGVLILGQNTNIETIRQLNLLGIFSTNIYFDCIGENLEKCMQIGITTIPTIIYSGQNYSGVKDIPFFEELTGCKLGR